MSVSVLNPPAAIMLRRTASLRNARGLVPFAFSPPVFGDDEAEFEERSGCHCCEDEQVCSLPPFLVVPIESVCCVEAAWRGTIWRGNEAHPSYWVRGAILTHFHEQTPDLVHYRGVNLREAVCLMAEQPRLGSVRVCDNGELYEPVIEACFWNGHVSLHRTALGSFCFPGYNHHRVWIPRSEVPEGSEAWTLQQSCKNDKP